MKPSTKFSTRREFIKNCSISAAIIYINPQLALKNNSSNIINVSVLSQTETNNSSLNILCKHAKIRLVKSNLLSDIILVDCINQNTIQDIYEAISNQKHLILKTKNHFDQLENDILQKCKKAGIMVAIIEEDEFANNLFKQTTLYQDNLSSSTNIKKCISFIEILSRSTQPNKLFIKP
jgi:hypothetical protein